MDDAPARVIAFYLPQFHPIPENDRWWGKGFTEWTNTARADPLFRGHYQPHVPADLGFYDLRLPETRIAQATLAKTYGIEAFCYYHYWFAGKRLLERPFNEVLASGEPDFPFCLCWANQSWTGIWHGVPDRVLMEQTYPGMDDHRRHFDELLPAFMDKRYLRVDGKPLFMIYRPADLPDASHVCELWREAARDAGLPGLYLVAEHYRHDWDPISQGYDAAVVVNLPPRRRVWTPWTQPVKKLANKLRDWLDRPTIYAYEDAVRAMTYTQHDGIENFPCAIPNWDNTPRSGARGLVLHESSPEKFRPHVRRALEAVHANAPDKRLVFVKSWNEWAEGNHLEPDLRYGHGYLKVVKEELERDR